MDYYKGFEIIEIRKFGDKAIFSKIIGYKGFFIDRGVKDVILEHKSKNELKKLINKYLENRRNYNENSK